MAERKNWTILETARSIYLSAKFPPHLWKEAVRTASHVRNRCGTRSLNLSTPFEAFTGTKPDIGHFCVIGCTTYVFIPKEARGGKLHSTNFRAVLVGYDDHSKAYRLYEPIKHRIIISQQVEFLEQHLGDFGTISTLPCDVFSSLFDSEGDLRDFQQREGDNLRHIPGQAVDAPLPEAEQIDLDNDHHLDLGAEQQFGDNAPQAAVASDNPAGPPAAVAPIVDPVQQAQRRYPLRERCPTERSKLYYRTDDLAFTVDSDEPLCDKITVREALAHKGSPGSQGMVCCHARGI